LIGHSTLNVELWIYCSTYLPRAVGGRGANERITAF